MKHDFWYTMTIIAAALALITFWAGVVFIILAACKTVLVPLWEVILIWLALLIMLIILIAAFYTLAEKAEQKRKQEVGISSPSE